MIDRPVVPGFHLHHGNRLERLVATLAGQLRDAPADPLVPDVVLVPHPGMAQWLKMRLADELGIAAHLSFPLPGVWFGRLTATDVAQDDALAWSRDVMTWRIFAMRAQDPGPFSSMTGGGERDQLARWQLAGQVAQLFERYQLQRPDWLRAWSGGQPTGGGDSERWQARLWQRLLETASAGEKHAIRQRLGLVAPAMLTLPSRLFAFGFASLPHDYLQQLHMIARRIPVHLFFTNPCRWYWGDLLSVREQLSLSRRLDYKPALDPDAEGHPVLAGFGAVGRDFFRQLYGGDATFASETEQFDESSSTQVLAQIQNGIVSLDAGPLDWAPDDGSIRLLVAPGRRRELEALHDVLLDLLGDRARNLRPRDIAVMVPKLSDYAPLISAVFGGQPRERHIPWQVTDLAETERHPLVALFLTLVDLPGWRFALGDVLDALARPSFARAFGIDTAELPRLSTLLAEAGARWGLDGAFRARIDAGDEDAYTFGFAIDRLLAGWMLGEGVAFDGETAPQAALRGSDADLVGRFVACLDTLDRWRGRLLADRTLADWSATLVALCKACFADSGDDDDNAALLRLMQAIDRWSGRAAMAADVVVPRRVVRRSLSDALQSTAVSALPGEGVNLCAMVPLRGLPFRVIVLLGLGEGEFPRRDSEHPDDLCRQRPRPGDRSIAAEDRYLFLEAVTSARDVLVLSHVDRDPETGQPQAPSPVLAEFHDYLRDAAFAGDAGAVAARIEQVALLPGDGRHFSAAAAAAATAGAGTCFVPSHAHEWLAPPTASPPRVHLPPSPPRDWRALCSLFVDPARTQMRWRGVDIGDRGEPVDDAEPFELDGLQAYRAREVILGVLAADAGASRDDIARQLAASALLPPGRAGQRAFKATWDDAVRTSERHGKARGDRQLEPRRDVMRIGGIELDVRIDNVDTAGLLRLGVGRNTSRRRMAAWLDLVALAVIDGRRPLTATLSGLDGDVTLQAPADPVAIASRLLEVWQQARCEPLPIYPSTSAAYAEAARTGDTGRAQAKALVAWEGGNFGPAGERHDPACAELSRCFPRWDAAPFADLAVELFTPLFTDDDA